MKPNFEKVHIMPIVLTITPPALTLPGVPMTQRQQAITGVIKWSVSDWNKAEYEKVQRRAESIMTSSSGKEIEAFITKLAMALQEILPNRSFSVSVGAFGIEHKAKKGGTK